LLSATAFGAREWPLPISRRRVVNNGRFRDVVDGEPNWRSGMSPDGVHPRLC
jgi:hypothetical protein